MSENLKVCPFCEGAVVPTESQEGWSVKCGNCGLKTERFKTRFQLKKYWDDRPSEGITGDFKEVLNVQRDILEKQNMILFIAEGGKRDNNPGQNEQLPPA